MTKVLVVDDDPILRKITALSLERDGFDVVTADSAAQALEIYDKSVDVAVLDLMMPDMDGRELFRRLREVDPGVKAVFLTARHDQEKSLVDEGAAGVLRKPFDAPKLGAQLRSIVGL